MNTRTHVKPTRKRTRLSPETRRELILDHASRIISKEGVAKISIERIGREAGISKSLVYKYFTNLNEVLVQLLTRELRAMRLAQTKVVKNPENFEELVRSMTTVYLRFAQERGQIIERLEAEPSVKNNAKLRSRGRDNLIRFFARTATKIFELPPETARAKAAIAYGMPASAGQFMLETGADLEDIAGLTTEMIMSVYRSSDTGIVKQNTE